jgi:hypothetical protein
MHYFLAMGAQPVLQDDQEQGVSFLLGAEKVHVLILKPNEMAQRNAILDALLSLSTLKFAYHLVYLAAPRLFGTSVDASIFRTRGIGLLFYDERRIDEAVAAQAQTEQTPRPMQQADTTVVTELATLRTMYLEMERTISQLRNDLATIRIPQPIQDTQPRIQIPTQEMQSQSNFPAAVVHGGALPSYFVNNPWLDVLSKRGSGEREPIAG